ncbi:MAG: trypsin-like serine protease [Deltaproteobacteria bacterium]|jgi:hypothetical protein
MYDWSGAARPFAFFCLTSAALACGAPPAGEADVTSGPETELGFVGSNLTVCEAIESPALVEAGTNLEERAYDFGRLSAELANDLEMQAITGIVTIDDCEDALAFVEARVARDVGQGSLEPVLADAGYPSELDEDGFGTTVRGIWNGEPSGDQRILRIRIPNQLGSPGDADPSDGSFKGCSAIAFSPRHLLTSAHCIPGGVSGYWRVRAFRGDSSGSDRGTPILLGNYRAYIYVHPNYTGSGDTEDDVALISMARQCVNNNERDAVTVCSGSPWERTPNNTNLMRLWLGNISVSTAMTIKGFGTTSRYSATPARLHFGDDGAQVSIDWTGSKHFLTDDEKKAIICKGDSGGPAMMTADWASYAAGVASNATMYGDQICAKTTGVRKQRWHRISGSFANWAEPKLDSNPWFSCPLSGSNCCHRASSANAYTELANHTYARCW